jgi:hypothetical protein
MPGNCRLIWIFDPWDSSLPSALRENGLGCEGMGDSMRFLAFKQLSALVLVLTLVGVAASKVAAQDGEGPPETPQSVAPIDLTGYWVSIVNEDWRWRMRTPPLGDFESVPLNDEGERVGNEWTREMDGQCQAYGVGGLMRIPTRLNITWQDVDTLQIESDAGSQVRALRFNPDDPGPRSLQGHSVARWDLTGDGDEEDTGYLRVDTSNVTAGWLRRNGVPYSEDATITEYFDRFISPVGVEWLTVLTIVTDPTYLNQPFVTSTQFKREPDVSKWMPTTCR